LRNPHFIEFCKSLSCDYTPPTEYILKKNLLEDALEEVKTWKAEQLSNGLITLKSDDWTSHSDVGCSNIEAITPSIVAHIETYARPVGVTPKDPNYIAGLFKDNIEKLRGIKKVIGICTDNEGCMRNLWEIVEKEVKGIVAVPCSAHLANLLMKDIGRIHWIDQVIAKTKDINKHIKHHSFNLTLFREKVSSNKDLQGKELVLPNETRLI
jgi:Protein of unknown function (DUF 659)